MKIVNLTRQMFQLRLKDGTILDCMPELTPFDLAPSVCAGGLLTDVNGFRVISTRTKGELPEPEPGVFYVVPKERCILEGRADLFYLPDPYEFADKNGVYECLAF